VRGFYGFAEQPGASMLDRVIPLALDDSGPSAVVAVLRRWPHSPERLEVTVGVEI